MTDQKEPPKSYKKKLKDAKTKEERIEMVRQAMEDGHSNKSAAEALDTTPGTIAGIRNKAKIPSTHDVPRMGKPAESEPRFVPFTPPPTDMTLRFAGSDWTHQCEAKPDGIQCGYRKVEGEKYCPKHLHLKQKQQSRD